MSGGIPSYHLSDGLENTLKAKLYLLCLTTWITDLSRVLHAFYDFDNVLIVTSYYAI